MAALSADQVDAATTKQNLEQQLREVHEWFKREVRPQAITAQVNRKVTDLIVDAGSPMTIGTSAAACWPAR